MTDYTETANDLVAQLAEHDITAEQDDVEERLRAMVEEYTVPVDEAKRSILRHYADEADDDIDGIGMTGGGTTEANVEDITSSDEWVSLEASVVQLWDADHETIQQTGLIGDETGRVKFTVWADNDLPAVEEDEAYRFENVVTDEWQGRMSVNVNSQSSINALDSDIEAAEDSTTLTGALVDIQSGSGLIERCPEEDCTRVLQNNRCSEHGEVDGEFDLRIKGVLDDGDAVQHVIFDRDVTEAITGTTLQDAKDAAQEALDTSVVEQEMTKQLVGRYYEVEGPVMGRYLVVSECSEVEAVDVDAVLDDLGVTSA